MMTKQLFDCPALWAEMPSIIRISCVLSISSCVRAKRWTGYQYHTTLWQSGLSLSCPRHLTTLTTARGLRRGDPPPADRCAPAPSALAGTTRPRRRHGGVGRRRRRRRRRGPVSARDPISSAPGSSAGWSLWPDAATGLPCPDYCTAALQEMKHLVTVGGDAASRWRGVGLFPPPLKVKPIDTGEQRPVFCSSCSVVVCMHMSLFGC